MAKRKYHKEETNEKAFLLARDKGLNKKEIAESLGISQDTFYTWIKKYPEFSEIIKKGQELSIENVINAMYRSATGYFIDEGKQYVEPNSKDKDEKPKIKKIIQYRKWIPPSNVAQFFILTNRKPEEWKHRKEFELQPEVLNDNIDKFCDTIRERDLKDVPKS